MKINWKRRSLMSQGKKIKKKILPTGQEPSQQSIEINCKKIQKLLRKSNKRLNSNTSHNESKSKKRKSTSSTNITQSLTKDNETDVINDTIDDCILIERDIDIIEITDDENETNETNETDPETNETDPETLNPNKNNELEPCDFSVEEGEILEDLLKSIEPSESITTTNNNINQKDDSKKHTLEELGLTYFYEDVSSSRGFDETAIPIYDVILSETFMSNDQTLQHNNISEINDKSIQNADDSVIFVGEEIDLDKFKPVSKAINYIPVVAGNVQGFSTPKRDSPTLLPPFEKFQDDFISRKKPFKNNNNLFTVQEHKRLAEYNTNTYNPNKDENVTNKPGKRMVIIDGSNVAFGHACNKEFSVKGLKICLEYFEKMGHEAKAVVPQFRLQKAKSTDSETLEKLHLDGKIVFTPCKNLPGKSSASYDDRFILQLASEFDAAIISNDNYRDLIHENTALKKIIENRVIGYTWCKDLFMLPKDPYGRLGPTLNHILNRS